MSELKQRAPGQKMTALDRIETIVEVKRLLIDGAWSPFEMAKHLGVDHKTAASYIEQANKLISGENLTIEQMRKFQVQRVQRDIEKIELDITAIRVENLAAQARGEKPSRQELFTAIRVKTDLYEKLHRITGLNTQVNLDIRRRRNIFFIRPDQKNQIPALRSGEQDEPI